MPCSQAKLKAVLNTLKSSIISRFPGIEGWDTLADACKWCHIDVIQLLLNSGAITREPNNNVVDIQRESMLLLEQVFPVWYGAGNRVPLATRDAVLNMLMDAGVQLPIEDDDLWFFATFAGTVGFVQRLISMVDPVDSIPVYAAKALVSACRHSRFDIIESLYPHLQINGEYVVNSELLEYVAQTGNKSVFVKLLSLYNINITASSSAGTGADHIDYNEILLYAATCGCLNIVRALLRSGRCDINKRHDISVNATGQQHQVRGTVLAAASDPAVIKALLNVHADVNPENSVPVLLMSVHKVYRGAVKMLLDAGADVSTDPAAVPPSSRSLDPSLLLTLLFATSDQTSRDEHIAVSHLLLNAGMRTRDLHAGLDTIARSIAAFQTPRNLPLVLKTLCMHDPGMLEAVDDRGRTPLVAWAQDHCVRAQEGLQLLLAVGANPLACDGDGMTVLMVLIENIRFGAITRTQDAQDIRLCDKMILDGLVRSVIGAVQRLSLVNHRAVAVDNSDGRVKRVQPRKRQRR
jgi:ankyrin repeat protein